MELVTDGQGVEGRSPEPPAATLPEALERGVAEGASLTFVDAQLSERQVSGAELIEAAERAAAGLRAAGLAPGDRVCLIGPTSPELVETLLGAWRAGLVPTQAPMPRSADTSAWQESLRQRMDLVGASAMLVPDQFTAMMEPMGVAPRTLGFETLVATGERLADAPDRGTDDVAYLQFTSGSTGASRAVALTHSHMLWNTYPVFEHAIGLKANDTRVSWLPLYHDFGLIFLLTGLFTGAPLVLQPTEQYLRRPGSWLDACDRFGAAATAGPNSAFGLATRELKLNPRELDLTALRCVLNGSEPVDVETMRRFGDAAGQYGMPATAQCAAYGLAESTLAVSWGRPGDPVRFLTVSRDGLGEHGSEVVEVPDSDPRARELVGCGTPIPEAEVRIVDADGGTLPAWRVGEIAVNGPSVMVGYWNDREATDATLRDGWLYTGDLGFVTDDGEVVPCGRIKDMIIAGGRNLYPEEYEFVTERVEGVRKGNSIAFSLPEVERMVVVAETKLPEGDEATELAKSVYARLREELDPPPSEVVLVPPGSIPKTSSGKRQRRLCRSRYEGGELTVVGSAKR